jgi:hypothetical protein
VMGLPFTVMETAAVSPAIGVPPRNSGQNVVISGQSPSPAGSGRSFRVDFSDFRTLERAFTLNRSPAAGQESSGRGGFAPGRASHFTRPPAD